MAQQRYPPPLPRREPAMLRAQAHEGRESARRYKDCDCAFSRKFVARAFVHELPACASLHEGAPAGTASLPAAAALAPRSLASRGLTGWAPGTVWRGDA